MKKYIFFMCVFLCNFAFANTLIDEVIAIVDDNIILKSEVENFKKIVNIDFDLNNICLKENINLEDLFIDEIIINKINYKFANKNNIQINNNQIEEFISNLVNKYNLSKDDFIKKLINNNIDVDIYKEFIEYKLINNIIYNEKIKKLINISDEEINEFCKKINENEIISLYTKYSFYCVTIPYKFEDNKISKDIINILKNNKSIHKLQEYIKDYKFINLNKIEDLKLKYINSNYSNYFNSNNKEYIIGPLIVKDYIYIIKVFDVKKIDPDKIISEINISGIFLNENKYENLTSSKTKSYNIYNDILNSKISFVEAAKKYSDDIYSSNKGGNLGWLILDYFNDELKKKISSLSLNEISKPFLYKGKWNIIKLIDFKKHKNIDFIKKNFAYENIFKSKFNKFLYDWINNAKENTYIKIIK